MLRLAGNVETLCQLEDGGAEQWYTPQVFDLAGLCRKLHRETDLLVESVGAQLSYQEDQSSVLVKGEEQLLSTLIYHLIANALYCLKGKGGEICLKLSRHGSQVLVTVEDNGGGMEERELMTAFEPESNESGLKPVGLGLTICRKIATLHGGALMLTSGKQGTRSPSLSQWTTAGRPLRSAAGPWITPAGSLRRWWPSAICSPSPSSSPRSRSKGQQETVCPVCPVYLKQNGTFSV